MDESRGVSFLRVVATAICVGCLSASVARAGLIAYDGFGYTPPGSDLQGNNGGFGFSGPWSPGGFNASIHDNYDIASGSLSFGGLATSGNSVVAPAVSAISGLTRSLSTPLGAAGSIVYLSFLIEPRGTLNQGAFNGFFGVLFERAGEPEIFMGKAGGGDLNHYIIEDRGGTDQFASGISTVIDETAFIVVKAEFGLTDTFTMYVNPTPGAPEPLSGVVKSVSIDDILGLTFYSTGAHALDELRLGTTFADVTPTVRNVPDTGPGMLMIFAVWFALLLGWRRAARAC